VTAENYERMLREAPAIVEKTRQRCAEIDADETIASRVSKKNPVSKKTEKDKAGQQAMDEFKTLAQESKCRLL
jgi:hypothetical protein